MQVLIVCRTFNFLVVMITGPAFANIRWGTCKWLSVCLVKSLTDSDLLFTISNGFIIFPVV